MIKNEREYRITKAQAKNFEQALDDLRSAPSHPAIHPRLQKAESDALRSQLEELREDLRSYEGLRDGATNHLTIESFDELPDALIQARIAARLSQKDLAEKLGLKEQQIQRYEATRYAGASLTRISEIINALNVRIHKDVYLPTTTPTVKTLYTRAHELGLDRDFLLNKLLTPHDRAIIERTDIYSDDETAIPSATATLDRIFNLPPGGFLSPKPPTLTIGAAQFKVPGRLGKGFMAYTAYAHYLAKTVLDAHNRQQERPISNPQGLRQEIITRYGALTLQTTLHYTWDLGIPVVPLHYQATFHGACWRENYRHVIVLKQRTPSLARWLNDLIHELAHTNQHADEPDFAIIETGESPLERTQTTEEREATEFASTVVLSGRQEELAQKAVKEAQGRLEFLKRAVVIVAAAERADVGALANYLAYRLSQQGENWWGAATNLQPRDENPWEIARDVFCERMKFHSLSTIDQTLLNQALRP